MIVIFFIFASLGMYKLLAHTVRIPLYETQKALIINAKSGKSMSESLDVLLQKYSLKLAKIIKLDNYKKGKLAANLKSAEISATPESYIAFAILKAIFVLLVGLPVMLIIPLFIPVFGVFAAYFFKREYSRAEIKIAEKRDSIEADLPRFVATVSQELKSGRDILAIMENFKKSANEKFSKELNIACADMRSGSYETALTRFEARINSPMLSETIRGLISAARGDDSSVYFGMLSHDFKLVELQKLKKQAQKIPGKIRIYSLLMLGMFLAMYFIVMGIQIIDSVGSMGI